MTKCIWSPVPTLLVIVALSYSTLSAAEPKPTEKVPVFLNGIILKAPDVDTCNQGKVKWLMQDIDPSSKQIRKTRLSAKNNKAEEFLNKAVGKRTRVLVAGYFIDGVEGPQCGYLDCYYAGVAQDAFQELQKVDEYKK